MKISRILVVEDSRADQELIWSLLRKDKLGNQLIFADSFDEAWQKILSQPFDLILTDVFLPDGNGIDLCQKLRDHPLSTPVICMSGVTDSKALAKAKQAGVDQFLVKPFSFESLHYAIKRLDRFWLTVTHEEEEGL